MKVKRRTPTLAEEKLKGTSTTEGKKCPALNAPHKAGQRVKRYRNGRDSRQCPGKELPKKKGRSVQDWKGTIRKVTMTTTPRSWVRGISKAGKLREGLG